ncbi:L-seryl-tRNA(Sec) selenium transferase [Clostridium fermenticellae]|uniref:L-seryl-tRNA(Sec) selenium transferase n=1 Tax=Clostridium fermenticellae TaxID=2068654 RepID=A0A386H5H3_9CLOT|nr:L-seryl-tRNA(Sec) selenium transferase [Clostridium fermenticellae]AYD41001.1 L-seryl-tRNA(Sec) selenium transferase [Clostridium fermenticellae]
MLKNDLFRKLPKVDQILDESVVKDELKNLPRKMVMTAVRRAIDNYRNLIIDGKVFEVKYNDILREVIYIIEGFKIRGLKKVINASGVVIHTNLGRSVLPKKAIDNIMNVAQNYTNLEYDLETGKRGLRYSHVEELIKKLTGAQSALVVNNNAAAVMLALNTICKDKEAVVSRGQLVEIGGSFRIPDVMTFSGASLVEVGTTNRTHLYDYERAINENTGVLLKVHTSNFKILGFTEDVALDELVKLSRKNLIPIMEDIGSGTLVDFSKYGFTYEPTVQRSIESGVDVVTFSGDKMLGGPQAGIIVGKSKYVDKMKQNQLTRALRVDKMTLSALEGTLMYYMNESKAIDNIPTLNMILSSSEKQKKRAQVLMKKIKDSTCKFECRIDNDYSLVGGGSMPTEKIPTYVVRVKNNQIEPETLETKLRKSEVPIIVRISNDEITMDLRTIFDKDFDIIAKSFKTIGDLLKI